VPGRGEGAAAELAQRLADAGYDARMLQSRAVVLAVRSLAERTLAGSPAFEIATRARQAGVPCYAVAARNRLDSFDARILDLQVVLEAATEPELEAAGRELARVV
jgi:glycerate kinase